MNFIIAPEAADDLSEIYDYIAKDSLQAADQELDRLLTAIQRIANGELDGPPVQLIRGRPAYGWSVRPYRIYYERIAGQTHILRVYHGARRPIE
jgi:plasmid stabilization system protein ParE